MVKLSTGGSASHHDNRTESLEAAPAARMRRGCSQAAVWSTWSSFRRSRLRAVANPHALECIANPRQGDVAAGHSNLYMTDLRKC